MPIREPGGLNGAVYGRNPVEMQEGGPAAPAAEPTLRSMAISILNVVQSVKDFFADFSLFS
jgi:hypothetical protein